MDANLDCQPPLQKFADGILHLRKDGSIISADKKFCNHVGMPLKEIQDRNWMSLFHPFDAPAITLAVNSLQLSGEAHLTLRGIRSDGSTHHMYAHLCRDDNTDASEAHYFCILMDIGNRINYNNDTEYFEHLFSLSNDLMCIATTMGYFLQVNPAFTRVLGYTREELLDTSFLEFIHPDDVDATLREIRKLRSGKDSLYFENRYRCKDGGWRWLAWSTPASDGEGLLYAVAKDISERKQVEDQLLRLAKLDFLTGLPNRAYLDDELQRAMARVARNQQTLAGLYIDLDNFRDIQRRHGPDISNDLLRHVAIRLRRELRACDFVARIGEDEFFILAEFDNEAHIQLLAAKVEQVFSQSFVLDILELKTSASVGFAIYQNTSSHDLQNLIEKADNAMHRNRRSDTRL